MDSQSNFGAISIQGTLIKLSLGPWLLYVNNADISPSILFLSNRPDLDQIVTDESSFLSARLSSWIASKQFKHVEKTVADQKLLSRGRLGSPRIWWGSGAYTLSTLRTVYESSRGRARQGDLHWPAKTTTGRRLLINYYFSTWLKTVADHFSVPDPRRTETIAPDLPPKV